MAVTEPMSEEDLLALPVTVDVETAGRAFRMGKTKSNDLARAGKFPVEIRKLGKRRIVTKAALLTALGYEWDGSGWRAAVRAPKSSAA